MVKTILKRNNVLLSQFASDLNISRPTLDAYIKNYDRGEQIANNLYQKIFDFLFSDVLISNIDFSRKYAYVMDNYGNSINLHSSSSSISSSLISLVNDGEITNYLTDSEESTLTNLIVRKDPLLFGLLKYYLLLNKKESLNVLSDKDKMMCTSLFLLNEKITNSDYTYDDATYQSFEEKITLKQETKSKEELKRQISEKLNSIVNDAVDNNDVCALNELLAKLNIKWGINNENSK